MNTDEDKLFRLLKRPTWTQLNDLWNKSQKDTSSTEYLYEFLERNHWTREEFENQVDVEFKNFETKLRSR